MDKNRQFVEFTGICWHEHTIDCMYSSCHEKNPDYAAEPWKVLEVMSKREDRKEFLLFCRKKWEMLQCRKMIGSTNVTWLNPDDCFIDYILNRTGLLRDKAIEWLKMQGS